MHIEQSIDLTKLESLIFCEMPVFDGQWSRRKFQEDGFSPEILDDVNNPY